MLTLKWEYKALSSCRSHILPPWNLSREQTKTCPTLLGNTRGSRGPWLPALAQAVGQLGWALGPCEKQQWVAAIAVSRSSNVGAGVKSTVSSLQKSQHAEVCVVTQLRVPRALVGVIWSQRFLLDCLTWSFFVLLGNNIVSYVTGNPVKYFSIPLHYWGNCLWNRSWILFSWFSTLTILPLISRWLILPAWINVVF